MVRGEHYCICPACRRVFKGMDIELHATARSMPIHCPECGAEAVKLLPVIRLSRRKD